MSSYLAANLEGKTIGGWRVLSKVKKTDGSGGGFSSGYVVERDGVRAYLKAMNVQYAFRSTGRSGAIMDALKDLTDDFIHERDILAFCSDRDLNRIVVALDSGEYLEAGNPFPVPYLVFELCDSGDVRRNPSLATHGLSWRLRVFHGACIGVYQLHSNGISHQDIKPANVLVFGQDVTKLADLGRSTTRSPGSRFGNPSDHGDITYSPFELYYGHYHADWDVRRKAVDIFMLGGILVFLVCNVNLVGLVFSRLPPTFHPRRWTGTYADALPALVHAFDQSVAEICATVREDMRAEIEDMIRWLCNPDPTLRGHPKTVIQALGDRFSLERVISVVDRVATKARITPA